MWSDGNQDRERKNSAAIMNNINSTCSQEIIARFATVLKKQTERCPGDCTILKTFRAGGLCSMNISETLLGQSGKGLNKHVKWCVLLYVKIT